MRCRTTRCRSWTWLNPSQRRAPSSTQPTARSEPSRLPSRHTECHSVLTNIKISTKWLFSKQQTTSLNLTRSYSITSKMMKSLLTPTSKSEKLFLVRLRETIQLLRIVSCTQTDSFSVYLWDNLVESISTGIWTEKNQLKMVRYYSKIKININHPHIENFKDIAMSVSSYYFLMQDGTVKGFDH